MYNNTWQKIIKFFFHCFPREPYQSCQIMIRGDFIHQIGFHSFLDFGTLIKCTTENRNNCMHRYSEKGADWHSKTNGSSQFYCKKLDQVEVKMAFGESIWITERRYHTYLEQTRPCRL